MPKKVSEIPGCAGCPMAVKFPDNNFVAPFIVPGHRIVVAEAPGEVESERGEPLCGPSGSWLRGKESEGGKRTGGLYRAAGVDESTVSRINVIQCRPPKNVFPTDPDAKSYITPEEAASALRQCFECHVAPVLRSRDWHRIDVLGDKSLRAVCEKEGIMRWRGSPLPVPVLGDTQPRTVPTLHPAFIARSQELLPAVVNDLKKSLIVPPETYDTHPSLDTVRNFRATEFAFDIETIRATGEITMVGLCSEVTKAICVPAKGAYLKELKRIFENATLLVSHNGIQFDIPRLFPLLGLEWRPDG